MNIDDIRYLFAYDQWGHAKVLDRIEGIDAAAWSAPDVFGGRSPGDIDMIFFPEEQSAARAAEKGPRGR